MNQRTVYLIDDEEDLLDLLADCVPISDYSVRQFSKAAMFVEQVIETSPGSVVVLDLHMPGMDGIELMRWIANLNTPPSLILISGKDSEVLHSAEQLGRAHNLSILASLTKPIKIGQFRRLLEIHASTFNKFRLISGNSANTEIFTPAELSEAIAAGELVLHYQPQLCISTGKPTGVEALVRWQHPKWGLIYPGQFVPMAEQNGMMAALTDWVVETVVQQQKEWLRAGLVVTVSVNISVQNLASLALPDQLARLFSGDILDPTRIVLEITESALMDKVSLSLDTVTRLRMKGFKISIDDFGTGYASFSQLYRLPVTELKIDRGFVSFLTEDDEAYVIVKACIALGHEFKLRVVAEGVETAEQWQQLALLGCDEAQGYYVSRPVTENQVVQFMRKAAAEI